jgi:Ca-activated chloride channel family protein
MKTQKPYSILSVLIVLSMFLSACGGFANSANQTETANNKPPLFQFSNSSDNENYRSDSPPTGKVSVYGGEAEEGASVAPEEEPMAEMDAASGGAPGYVQPSSEGYHPPYPTQLPPTYDNPYEDTFFQDYGTNPFIDTEDDHLSTFSMDVDTGSFTLSRSYIMDGYLPPADAVRVEEFINYFPQGYPMPSERDVFGIYIDGAPSPFTETDRYEMLRVGVQGYDVDPRERKPVSLTFVIDVSGSMYEGGRLELVKESLELLVDELDRDDQVTIIAYSTEAWVVLDTTPGNRKSEIIRVIRQLYPMNSTNAEAGLELGYDYATHAYLSGGINRVVLCSDGVANVGETGPGSIWEKIKFQASEGITLTSIGVGMGNYNDVLLEQLADNGEGNYYYIDTIDEAERIFVHDLVSTLQVIAMDAKIQVDFNPEVVSRYRLVGYENRDIADEDFRNDRVDAAEIGAGHTVTSLYEFKLHPGARGEIATVHLRWQDPDTGRVYEMAEQFFTDDMEGSFRSADPYFQLDVLVAEFAELLRESYWAESSFDEVLDLAERTARQLEEPQVFDLLDMLDMAAWIRDY